MSFNNVELQRAGIVEICNGENRASRVLDCLLFAYARVPLVARNVVRIADSKGQLSVIVSATTSEDDIALIHSIFKLAWERIGNEPPENVDIATEAS